MRKSTIRAAVAVLVLAASAGAAFAQESGNVANGQKVFMADGCYQCHGTTGSGGGSAGPKLAPQPLPLDAMVNQLRMPMRMPRYSAAVISDAEIADIHAYLASMPPGKTAAQIPMLANLK